MENNLNLFATTAENPSLSAERPIATACVANPEDWLLLVARQITALSSNARKGAMPFQSAQPLNEIPVAFSSVA
jgi:hypothetical protein